MASLWTAVKKCSIPSCSNTTGNSEKIFLRRPRDNKDYQRWYEATGKNPKGIGKYCCEDHFELADDAENYMRVKLMGGKLRLKKHVVPHKYLHSPKPDKKHSQLFSSHKKQKAENMTNIEEVKKRGQFEEVYLPGPSAELIEETSEEVYLSGSSPELCEKTSKEVCLPDPSAESMEETSEAVYLLDPSTGLIEENSEICDTSEMLVYETYELCETSGPLVEIMDETSGICEIYEICDNSSIPLESSANYYYCPPEKKKTASKQIQTNIRPRYRSVSTSTIGLMRSVGTNTLPMNTNLIPSRRKKGIHSNF